MSKLVGKYTAKELLNTELLGSKPLIENFLYECDNVLLLGKEKANKSTLALQICCHLSCAKPLFNQFEIPRAINCVYIQAEGKLGSTQTNLRNMLKSIPCDPENILFLYYPNIPLNKPEGLEQIIRDIESWKKPELIVVDPLYQSMSGDICSQEESSNMTGNLRLLAQTYSAALILVHHAHRPFKNQEGEIIDEGDDSVFGSFVWKAFPDTVFLLEKVKGHSHYRRFSCSTQRMGNVVSELELMLIEPEPFCLSLRDGQPIDQLIELNIGSTPISIKELIDKTGRSRQNIHYAIQRLLSKGRILKAPSSNSALLYWKEKC